jgi:hypothetical protein
MPDFPDMRGRDPESLAAIFRYFGEIETPRLDSAVYTAYSLGIAQDPEILELAALVRSDQPPPNVLYAAVHDLLLESAEVESAEARDAESVAGAASLARWYPSVSGSAIPEESPWRAFRSFCLENASRLEPALRSGRTQTCVVHRSAMILPALGSLAGIEAAAGRVGLLEIGPSAGLNLRLDRYRYDYGDGDVWGDAKAAPCLVVENRGGRCPPLPARLEVVARCGLELNPLDLSDPAAIRWLRALIWPEHVERARAMDAALAVVEAVPAEIQPGDATSDVEAAVRSLPRDCARVVFATQVLYQIPIEGRRAILDGLGRASEAQPVDFISMESTGEGDSTLTHFAFEGGTRAATRELASVDSHGRWIDWHHGEQTAEPPIDQDRESVEGVLDARRRSSARFDVRSRTLSPG